MKSIAFCLIVFFQGACANRSIKIDPPSVTRTVPLSLECHIFSQNFPGIQDHLKEQLKRVTLTADNISIGGRVRVDQFDGYEFSVQSGERLNDGKGRKEIFSYEAQIKNLKTGVIASSRSDDRTEAANGAAIKLAKVALQLQDALGLTTGSLSMHCLHRPNSNEKLTLSHE